MEIHYGQNRITLFPQDIEEEMAFDGYESGTKICTGGTKDKPDEVFEVVDKVVCLRVKKIKNLDDLPIVENKKIKKWWQF